jgi:hypothetical protein
LLAQNIANNNPRDVKLPLGRGLGSCWNLIKLESWHHETQNLKSKLQMPQISTHFYGNRFLRSVLKQSKASDVDEQLCFFMITFERFGLEHYCWYKIMGKRIRFQSSSIVCIFNVSDLARA